LLCAVQFMVVLDVTIVNVALPAIGSDLGFSASGLQWVVGAYAVVFGGFLLLGGRAADLAGRRRMLRAGLVLFSASSAVCGLAWSPDVLVAARCLQGLGAALLSPAALSLLAARFPEGRERASALGAWGSVGAFAAASGFLLGGLVVQLLSWEWIFLANVPIGMLALVATPFVLDESRAGGPRGLDLTGAVYVTGGVALLVYALTAPREGVLLTRGALLLLATAAVLLALFARRQRRAPLPLIPRGAIRWRSVAGANLAGFLQGAMMLATYLLLALGMQQVLGYSPIATGLGLLAVRGTSIGWARVAGGLVGRHGPRPVLLAGMAAMTLGLLLLTRLAPGASYATTLLPGLLVMGLAIPFVFVGAGAAALSGVHPDDAGLASGLLAASQWVGGAIGLALVSAVSGWSGHTGGVVSTPDLLADGVRHGLWVCVALGSLGLVAVVSLVPAPTRRLPA
jgi:EmrB/QacA subfamily drug resistance transporter